MCPWRHEQECGFHHCKYENTLEIIKMFMIRKMSKCHIMYKQKFYKSMYMDEKVIEDRYQKQT